MPITVTLSDIIAFLRAELSRKAPSPIEVTVSGITIVSRAIVSANK